MKGTRPASGIPARGYVRPPFTHGNLVRLTHGATTLRVYGPLATELAAGLLEDRPDLAAYPEAVAAWATRHRLRCCAATWPRWAPSTPRPANHVPTR